MDVKRFSVRIQVRLGSGVLIDRKVNIGAANRRDAQDIAYAIVSIFERRARVVSDDVHATEIVAFKPAPRPEEFTLEEAILWAQQDAEVE